MKTETKMTTGLSLSEKIMKAIYSQSHGTEFGFVKDDAWVKKIQLLALLFFSRNNHHEEIKWVIWALVTSLHSSDETVAILKDLEGFKDLYSVLTDYKNSLN